MGLLDALLSGQQGGGLLDFLRNNALNQQAMGGLPSDQAQYGAPTQAQYGASPMQANVQAPIPQQPPPVISSQIQPQQAAPQQPQAMQQPQSAPQAGGLGAGVSGFIQNLHTGPIGALMGGIGGAMGMQDPKTQLLAQHANITAQALIAKGVDPQVVAAAVGNGRVPGEPELLKTLIAQNFGPDRFQHVTRKGGPLEGEQAGTFDPATGKYKWDTGSAEGAAPAGGVQAMADNIAQKRASGASRDELVKLIPTQYQGYITSLLDGKATPVNMGRGPERGALMTLAHSIDPTFDETMIPARIQTAKDFTPQGKSGASIVAFNTVQHHIGKLSDDFEKLGDAGQGGFQLINAARNGLATQTSFDPQRQKAVQAVNDDIKAVTDEMSAAYKAGHVSDTEIKSWNSLVNSNLPLNQAHQAISDFVDLLNGKRDALNTVHRQIMGGDAQIIDKEENAAISKKVHDRNAGITSAPTANAAPDRSAIEAEMRRRGLMK